MGYEQSFIKEQIGEARRKDRETLLCNSNKTSKVDGLARVSLVTSYHPALNSIGKVAHRLHSMLSVSEEHRRVFPEPPLVSFKRCKSLKAGIHIVVEGR